MRATVFALRNHAIRRVTFSRLVLGRGVVLEGCPLAACALGVAEYLGIRIIRVDSRVRFVNSAGHPFGGVGLPRRMTALNTTHFTRLVSGLCR